MKKLSIMKNCNYDQKSCKLNEYTIYLYFLMKKSTCIIYLAEWKNLLLSFNEKKNLYILCKKEFCIN